MAGPAVTCQIRYTLDLNKLPAFESYARTWMMLIDATAALIMDISSLGPPQREQRSAFWNWL